MEAEARNTGGWVATDDGVGLQFGDSGRCVKEQINERRVKLTAWKDRKARPAGMDDPHRLGNTLRLEFCCRPDA